MRWTVNKKTIIDGVTYYPGQEVEVSRDVLRNVDAYEGRVRAYHDEMEAVIALAGALQLMDRQSPKMERLAKKDPKNRTWNKLRTARSLLEHALEECRSHITLEQLLSLKNSTDHHTIVISALKKPGMVNIEEEQVDLLMRAAMSNKCSRCVAGMIEREWKDCDLRRLFDTLLVRGNPREKTNSILGLCPYVRDGECDDD